MKKLYIPAACPICAAPCEFSHEYRNKILVWRCGLSKRLFRVIVYKEREQ